MPEVDKWMGQFNTTTQSLNKYLCNEYDRNFENYIRNLFTILVGNIKLQIALDQRVILQDNHLVDSGLIRALFKYGNYPEIGRMLRELKELMLTFGDHFLYVHDNRISNDNPDSLVLERFNLTANSNYVHSASFGDERWSDISDEKSLKNELPEYKHIFLFLIDFVERIPSENIISNPQQDGIFIELLKTDYENNKNNYIDYVSTQLRICIDRFSNDRVSLNRSGLYSHFDNTLGRERSAVAKRLIADQVYSDMVPKGLESLNFRVDTTELATIFTDQDLKGVYKEEVLMGEKNSIDLTSNDCLSNKYEIYLLVSSLTAEELKSLRNTVRSLTIYQKDKDKIINKVLSEMYSVYKARKSSSLNAFRDISASIKVLPEGYVSTIIPVRALDRLSFLYTRHFNPGWKKLSEKVDLALSGKN